jgi:hypothetical protein
MKFMRCRAGYSLLDRKRNEDILEEHELDPVETKLAQYKRTLLYHISRMEDIRYPEQLLDYRPMGRRPGRPLKRLLDGYNRETETGHLMA